MKSREQAPAVVPTALSPQGLQEKDPPRWQEKKMEAKGYGIKKAEVERRNMTSLKGTISATDPYLNIDQVRMLHNPETQLATILPRW